MLGQAGVERRGAEGDGLGQLDLPHDERTARQVESHLHERLVERVEAAGETSHAGLVAQRLPERLAQDDRRVLHRVVAVDVQVTGRDDGEVEPAVAAELVEHVVVERQTGRDLGATRAVELDGDGDRGLLGRALTGCR